MFGFPFRKFNSLPPPTESGVIASGPVAIVAMSLACLFGYVFYPEQSQVNQETDTDVIKSKQFGDFIFKNTGISGEEYAKFVRKCEQSK